MLRHTRPAGETVHVGDVLGRIEPGGPAVVGATKPGRAAAAAPKPAASPTPATKSARSAPQKPAVPPHLSPAVRRIVEERGIDPREVHPTGPGGRLLKEDVERHPHASATPAPAAPLEPAPAGSGERDRVVPMSRLRLKIAERMVQAQHTAAILTTFNEIDMTRVLETRARWKEAFEKTHGVKLGFMSFFARACVLAIADVPEANAEIRDTDVVYHDHVHLGVAASTDRGLVVPVVRNAEGLDFAGLEREIGRLAARARDGSITPQELSGGTFTISNGGVFGSLLSTPILNPPQSGILGMHKIEKRPMVVGDTDTIVVRPMMYVALSYDHRLLDGRGAVTFLVRVKERLEDPERLLLGV